MHRSFCFFFKKVSAESINCISLRNDHGLYLDIFKILCIGREHFKTARIFLITQSMRNFKKLEFETL